MWAVEWSPVPQAVLSARNTKVFPGAQDWVAAMRLPIWIGGKYRLGVLSSENYDSSA
jgi:hypothetical protein